MDYSWIPLARNLRQMDWFYSRSNLVHLWIEILYRVARKRQTYPVGNELITLEPGQFVCSIRKLASFMNINRETLSGLINLLIMQGWLKKEPVGNMTLFTVTKEDQLPLTNENQDSGNIPLNKTIGKNNQPKQYNFPNNLKNDFSKEQSITSATLPATNKYNNKYKNKIFYKREENLKFYKEIRNDQNFWLEMEILLETEKEKIKETSEEYFRECIVEKNFFETLIEFKAHLVEKLKNIFMNSPNRTKSEYEIEKSELLEKNISLIKDDKSWIKKFCNENKIEPSDFESLLESFKDHCLRLGHYQHQNHERFRSHFINSLKYLNKKFPNKNNGNFKEVEVEKEYCQQDYSDTDFGGRKY